TCPDASRTTTGKGAAAGRSAGVAGPVPRSSGSVVMSRPAGAAVHLPFLGCLALPPFLTSGRPRKRPPPGRLRGRDPGATRIHAAAGGNRLGWTREGGRVRA